MLEDAPSAFGSDWQSARALPLSHFRERTTGNPESFIVGGFHLDELIATAGAYRETSLKRRHIATIVGMFVHPAHRRAGLGRDLLRSVLDRLDQLPLLERVQLAVTAGNDGALALYEEMGFEVYGREPAALKVAGNDYDEFHLALTLRKSPSH